MPNFLHWRDGDGNPADGGVKAAAQLKKKSHHTASKRLLTSQWSSLTTSSFERDLV